MSLLHRSLRPSRRVTTPAAHWRLLADLVRPHRGRVAVLALVLAVASALPLAGPQLLRAFIDSALEGAALGVLLGIAGAYLAVGVGAQLATVGVTYAANRVAWDATNALRERAALHALRLDLAYHRDTRPGALIQRVDGDATEIARFITDFVVRVAVAALMLGGAMVLVAREDWRVAAGLGAFVAVGALLVVRLRDHAVPASTAQSRAEARVHGTVEERLAGAEDLRALGAAPHALARLHQASAELLTSSRWAFARQADLWGTLTALSALAAVGMLLAGGWLHLTGAVTLGTVVLLWQYVDVLRRPLEEVSEQLQEVQRAAAGAARIAGLLDTEPSLEPGGDARLPPGPLSVVCDGVGFAYPDDGVPVLEEVDLSVPAGTTLGLVGRTGCGKTTLARLALRLMDPTKGAVRVGGLDLRDVADDSRRARLAIVTQDVQLLRGTLRDNLTLFGATPAPDATLRALLGELGLGAWLEALPGGLDTELGAGGSGTSAGQAQLLGLARVFLRDPGVVVLDEASSRVDPATQARIDAATARLLAGRTSVVIAHRLSTIRACDATAVMAAGRVVEHGPTRELAADSGSHLARLLATEAADEEPVFPIDHDDPWGSA
ncbi:ABC transporter ATP-binding protein [Egibacter rhizosphaerae]|uniref:ABC transporter ATP-binding protein n=1 Tax=Egibacter rhizosphaerae TaxID=1670831 RepID=A0A411YF67_9ACTN|nr:ABC transporter ATP-binding protein [Egibacter rhizosphaerae]QBI19829.1 ABC transporter ATP-binding protein [Egibacter rhizosphaerae]